MAAPASKPSPPYQAAWYLLLGLVGLDYFSTLGYQPSLAYEAAGLLAPLATAGLVLVTLLMVLPLYAHVAARAPQGQGVMGLLDRVVHGWRGKVLIVILLGFAATDFVFTKTLSVAAAAVHLVHNPTPLWQSTLDLLVLNSGANFVSKQLLVTIVLLLCGFLFWHIMRRGFRRQVITLALGVVSAYLSLNAIVIGSGLAYLTNHQEILDHWHAQLAAGNWHTSQAPLSGRDDFSIALVCLLLFPKLALGLSGFEMSMVVMPLVRGSIWNTWKLLATAAVIMSAYLLGSALVTTTLLSPEVMTTDGLGRYRSLAYLAHGGELANGAPASVLNPLFGPWFGSLYDLSAVLILSLAGASITLGLRSFVPTVLQRFGMQFRGRRAGELLFHAFNAINLIVTLVFHASIAAQRGAYATSVAVLIASAGLAVSLDRWQRRRGPWPVRVPWLAVLATLLFAWTALDIVINRGEGLTIAIWFILATLLLSFVSRLLRSTEPRFQGFQFQDGHSRFLWESLVAMDFPVLVPHRPGRETRLEKEGDIRLHHHLPAEVPVVFVEVHIDDASEFEQMPFLEVIQEEGRFVIRITHCASVAHILAATSLELSKVSRPPEIHFGWSDETPMAANLGFVLFGQGNVPWLVRELLIRAEADEKRRPRVVMG